MTDAFWSSRDVLEHILKVSRSHGAGPWSTLGVAMARAIATVPPTVTLPAIVGGRMSLNLFVALVGRSGAGKGASEAAALGGFTFGGSTVPLVPIGSGEGIARTFRPLGTKADEPNPVESAVLSCPEVDTLAAIASRKESTLSAELRKLYSGEPLGFGNSGRDTRNIIKPHSYRASLVLGVQPLRSDVLLGGSDGGLPQRFVWLPTSDLDAPDEPPADPGRMRITRPRWTQQDIGVPDIAAQAIRAHRLSVLREEPGIDPLDGHALLTQLKVAAALMALDGRTIIDTNDWSLASYVMQVSRQARERCARELRDRSRRTNTARALAVAERDEIISERKHARCKDGILRAVGRLEEGAVIPQNELRRGLKSDVRDCFDAAANELQDEGRLFAARTPKGIGYSGSTVDRTSTPPEQAKHRVDHRSTVDRNQQPHRRRERNRKRTSQQTVDGAATPPLKAPPDKPNEPPLKPRLGQRKIHGRCPECKNHVGRNGHRDDCSANI